MKSIVLFILSVIIICSISTVYAKTYSSYLKGNPNLVFSNAFTRDGAAIYLDKPTLDVEEYKPPFYTMSIASYLVSDLDSANLGARKIMRFRYDYKSGIMYYDTDGHYTWHRLAVTDTMDYQRVVPVGEILFAIAYKSKFYGLHDSSIADSFYNGLLQ